MLKKKQKNSFFTFSIRTEIDGPDGHEIITVYVLTDCACGIMWYCFILEYRILQDIKFKKKVNYK